MLLKWTGSNPQEEQEKAESTGTVGTPATLVRPAVIVPAALSALWILGALFYFAGGVGFAYLSEMLVQEQALVLIAVVLPPVFFWMVALMLRRGEESTRSRAALLEVLADISGPEQEAEARLNATAMSLRRISQTVESELENALARADALNERIDAGLSRLSQLSEGAGKQSEQAGELLERARGEQTRLLEELQSLGERTRSLARTEGTELTAAAEGAARRADEIAVLLDAKARTVSETVENASRRAAELGAAIDQPMNRMREESEQTVRRLATASQELKNRVEALSKEMGRTADEAGQASQGVDASAVRLRQASGEMRGLLSGTGEEIRQRIGELQELVTGAMRSSEQATQRIDQRLGQLAGTLDGFSVTAGETEEAMTSSADRISASMADLSEQAAAMRSSAAETADRTEAAAAGVLEASTSFSVASRQIDAANRRLGDSRDEISATVANLSGVVEETVSALEERIREVSSFAEGASERSGEKLHKVTMEIANSARSLGRQIALLEEQARGSEVQASGSADILAMRLGELNAVLTEISAESGRGDAGMKQLVSSGRELKDELSEYTGALNSAAEESASVATQSVATLNRSIGEVRRTSMETESRLGELASSLATHAGGLDAVSNRLAASAATIESEAAERLQSVAGQVDRLTRDADERFGNLSERLQALFGDLQARSGEMTSSVEAASDQTDAAGARLSQAMAELSLLLQEVDQSVSDAGDSFGRLDERVRGVATAIRGGVEDNLVLMEDRGREVTGRLFETAQELSAASEELERRSGFSLERLVELRRQTVGELAEVEGRLGGLTELWRERTHLFEGAAGGLQQAAEKLDGETAGRLISFTARMAEAVNEARKTVDGLEAERERLSETGRNTGKHLDDVAAELEVRLAAVADRAVQGAVAVRGEVDVIQGKISELRVATGEMTTEAEGNAGRIETILSEVQLVAGSLAAEVEQLATTSGSAISALGEGQDGIRENADQMRIALSDSARSIASEGERVASVLKHLRGQLSEADEAMSDRMTGLEQSVRGATDLAQLTSDALLAGTEAMIIEAGRVHEEMTSASESLAQQVTEIGSAGEDVAGKIAGAASELEIRADALRAAGVEAEGDVVARAESIARKMRELTETATSSRTAWEEGARSIKLATEGSEAHSRSAVAALQEAVEMLDAALPRAGGLQASAEALRKEGQVLSRTVVEMGEQSAATIEKVSDHRQGLVAENSRMAADLAAGFERMNAGLEEARARMSAFVTAEKAAALAVEEATDRVDGQLERSQQIASTMREHGAEVDSRIAQRIETLEAAERGAAEAAELLAESLNREQERLAGMRDVAMSDAETFAGSVASTLDDLKGRSALFAEQVDALNLAAEKLKADLSGSVEKMTEDARAAAAAGDRITEVTEGSRRKLAEQREAFATSAEDADRAASQARKMLAEQASAITNATKAANLQSGLAARSFENQATRLEEAARQAADLAARLEDTSRDSRDRRFLTSAAEVAGGLNSMALDLHRLLDAEGTETNWQKYQSGDRGIFARRLVSRSNRRKIAGAYHSDGEFRRSVDGYISEYEAVLSAAADTDHDGLLKGIFLSADVGKLYLVLCDALDRDPITSPKRKK